MPVGNGRSINGRNITGYFFLFYRISDLLTFFIYRQIGEAVFPLASCIRCYTKCFYCPTICKKFYGDACRAFTVLIVRIIPDLASADGSCLRNMGIFHMIAVNFCFISCNSFFADGIGNFLTLFVSRKVFKIPTPIICYGYRLAVNFGAILQQINRDACRTFTILIICIIPHLNTCNIYRIRSIAIRDVISINHCAIIFYRIFCYGINNFVSTCILRQIGKAVFPIAICTSFYCLTINRRAIRKQINGDAVRSLAILIICIIPGLASADFNSFRYMSIFNGNSFNYISFNACGIAIYFNFFNGILDLFSICILRKILKAPAPAIGAVAAHF